MSSKLAGLVPHFKEEPIRENSFAILIIKFSIISNEITSILS